MISAIQSREQLAWLGVSLATAALSDFLQECDFKVVEASQAQDALEMIASKQSVIDLVFSDVRMPRPMDGFGLFKWIRQNRPGLPVILASGDASKSDAAHELCAEGVFPAHALRFRGRRR